jgi:hypothetical protein
MPGYYAVKNDACQHGIESGFIAGVQKPMNGRVCSRQHMGGLNGRPINGSVQRKVSEDA